MMRKTFLLMTVSLTFLNTFGSSNMRVLLDHPLRVLHDTGEPHDETPNYYGDGGEVQSADGPTSTSTNGNTKPPTGPTPQNNGEGESGEGEGEGEWEWEHGNEGDGAEDEEGIEEGADLADDNDRILLGLDFIDYLD